MNHMLVLRAGHVFDGQRSLGEAAVLIEDGNISGERRATSPRRRNHRLRLDALPGLIDAHVHLAFDASADVVTSLAARDDDALFDHMEAAAADAAGRGHDRPRPGDRNYLSLALAGRFPATTLPHRRGCLAIDHGGHAISWGRG